MRKLQKQNEPVLLSQTIKKITLPKPKVGGQIICFLGWGVGRVQFSLTNKGISLKNLHLQLFVSQRFCKVQFVFHKAH